MIPVSLVKHEWMHNQDKAHREKREMKYLEAERNHLIGGCYLGRLKFMKTLGENKIVIRIKFQS